MKPLVFSPAHFRALFLSLTVIGLGLLFSADPIFAQGIDLEAFATEAGFTTQSDLRLVIARLLRTLIGFSGIVAVALLIYGGFLWLTSHGEVERVTKAKRLLIQVVIGLAIVFGSFAAVQFVIGSLETALGVEGGVSSQGGAGSGGGVGGGDPIVTRRPFALQTQNASCAATLQNTRLQLVFTSSLNQESFREPGAVVIRQKGGDPVAGEWTVIGSKASFRPSAICEGYPSARCLPAGKMLEIELNPTLIRSTSGVPLACGGLQPSCQFEVQVGSGVDLQPPTVSFTQPVNAQTVALGDIVVLQAETKDDVGVSQVEFLVDGESKSISGLEAAEQHTLTPQNLFSSPASEWNTEGVPVQKTVSLRAVAEDCAGNTTPSESIRVVVRPLHCVNGAQDVELGETGIDCGGTPGGADFCGNCAETACAINDDCRGGTCEQGRCRSVTRIHSVKPLDGAPGTLVTIRGEGFGAEAGKITFLGGTGVPTTAYRCNDVVSWNDQEIVVQVPEEAQDGPLSLTTALGISDRTDDGTGARFAPFDVNTIVRPGLCGLRPETTTPGASLVVTGVNLGERRDASTLYIGSSEATRYERWSNDSLTIAVPQLNSRLHDVQVFVGQNSCQNDTRVLCSNDTDCRAVGGVCTRGRFGSNTLALTISSGATSSQAPVLTTVLPAEGPSGQTITLSGDRFGDTVGQVVFTAPDGRTAFGSTDFPEECATSLWTPRRVVVRVPARYSNGEAFSAGPHELTVVRAEDQQSSLSKTFTVISGIQPGPSLCAIDPVAGPIGTRVTVIGDALGNDGAIRFRPDLLIEGLLWTDRRIGSVTVPNGAVSGPVEVIRADGQTTNALDFTIADCREDRTVCGGGTSCCSDGTCRTVCEEVKVSHYAGRFSTTAIPRAPELLYQCRSEQGETVSPTPSETWSPSGKVCINALIGGRFTTPIDARTLTSSSVIVELCKSEDCSQASAVEGDVVPFENGFNWRADAGILDVSTSYRVRVTTDVRSVSGIPLAQEVSWRFSTRPDTELCTIGSVFVDPTRYTAQGTEDLVDYAVQAQSAQDRCVLVDTEAFSWHWGVDRGDVAEIVFPNSSQPINQVRPLAESGAIPAHITAQADLLGKPSGFGELSVDFIDPRVASAWPSCDAACVNAAIGVRFNVAMEDTSLLVPGAIQLEKCANALCFSLTPVAIRSSDLTIVSREVTGLTGDELHLQFPDDRLLEPETYYRVTISGDVRSENGVPLSRSLTHNETGHSWIFRTKESSEVCRIDRIDVRPEEAQAQAVGERQAFYAFAIGPADSCSPRGQVLNWTAYDWEAWQSSEPEVASLVSNGALRLSNDLPSWCSGSCLSRGNELTFGEGVCGDGVISAAEDCDDGNSVSQDGCSATCLHEPVARCSEGATEDCCGNGAREGREECDDANDQNGDGCSASCLKEGSAAVQNGARCGNGVVDADPSVGGEECDDRNTRSGDGCSAQCLNEGTISAVRSFGVCGNGAIERQAGEECDNGSACSDGTRCTDNAICAGIGDGRCTARNSDGCSARCLNEGTAACHQTCVNVPGRTCQINADCSISGQVGVCGAPTGACCGNGTLESGEDCDDSNTTEGDGCSARCLNEGSSTTYATPSFCGDGIVQYSQRRGGEECEALGAQARIGPLAVAEILPTAPARVDSDTQLASSQIETKVGRETGEALYSLSCGCDQDLQCGGGTLNGCGVGGCCAPRPTARLSPVTGSQNVCRNSAVSVQFSQAMKADSLTQSADGKLPNIALVLTHIGDNEVTSTNCPARHTFVALDRQNSGLNHSGLARLWGRFMSVFGADKAIAAPASSCIVPTRLTMESLGNGVDGDEDIRVTLTLDEPLVQKGLYRLMVRGDQDITDAEVLGVLSVNGIGMNRSSVSEFRTGSDLCTLDVLQLDDLGRDPRGPTDAPSIGFFTKADEEHLVRATAFSRREGARVERISEIAGVYEWNYLWDTALADESENDILSLTSEDQITRHVRATGKQGRENVIVSSTTSGSLAVPPVTHEGVLELTSIPCENPWPSRVETFPWIEDGERFQGDQTDGTFFSLSYCRDQGSEGTSDDLPALRPVLSEHPPISTIEKEILFVIDESGRDALGVRVFENPQYLPPDIWYRTQGFTGTPSSLSVDGYEAVRDGSTVYVSVGNQVRRTDGEFELRPLIYAVSANPDAGPEARAVFEQVLQSLRFNAQINDQGLIVSDLRVCRDTSSALLHTENQQLIGCDTDLVCGAVRAGATCDALKSKLVRDTRRLSDAVRLQRAVISKGGAIAPLSSGTYLRSLSVSTWPSWNEQVNAFYGTSLADPTNKHATCAQGADPATCFEASTNQFSCPTGSLVYSFRNQGGQGYLFTTALEYDKATWSEPIDISPTDNGTIRIEGAYPALTLPVGFFAEETFCSGIRLGTSSTCGDGIKGDGEVCEIGETRIETDACTDGFKTIRCVDTASVCGFESAETVSCVDYRCGNGAIETGEECDEGGNNGRYGTRCTATCKIGNGPEDGVAFCGDGVISPGEACDEGDNNGDYCNPLARDRFGRLVVCKSCSLSCTLPGPSCGDGVVQEAQGEVCEAGEVERWEGKICSGGADAGGPCTNGTECESGVCTDDCASIARNYTGICATGASQGKPCRSGTECGGSACVTGTSPLTRTRLCNEDQCQFAPSQWKTIDGISCLSATFCGNGSVDENEQCDDGNLDETDGCTNLCKLNVCGDGYVYRGVESCDLGTQNGQGCTASYGDSCTECTLTCQTKTSSGAYCGNQMVESVGGEVCDGNQFAFSCINVQSNTFAVVPGILSAEACTRQSEQDQRPYRFGLVGLCNGGTAAPGTRCFLSSPVDAVAGTNCGVGGVCVAPRCEGDCRTSCPVGVRGASLSARLEPGTGNAVSEIDLLSYQPTIQGRIDSAALTIPACRAATGITVDIDSSAVQRPDVALVFATDLSGSMNESVTRGGPSRIEVVRESLQDAIDQLIGEYSEFGAQMNIALVSFKGDEAYVNTDTEQDGGFSNNAQILRAIADTYGREGVGNIPATGSTPTKAAIEAAKELLDGRPEAVQIVVLLSDGDPNFEIDGVRQNGPPAREATLQSIYDGSGRVRSSAEGIEFFTVAVGANADLRGFMKLLSSDRCNGSAYTASPFTNDDSCAPADGVEYAFSGTTREEIALTYQAIIQSVLNGVLSLTLEVQGSPVQITTPVLDGRSVRIPLPAGFTCKETAQQIPFQIRFNGEGEMHFENFNFTHCPR